MIFITFLGIYIGISIALCVFYFSMEEGKILYRDAKSKVEGGKIELIIFDAIVITLFISLMPIMVVKEYIKK